MVDLITKNQRFALMCGAFFKNYALYLAGWRDRRFIPKNNDILRVVNGNFLDIAVLEWCKIFAEKGDFDFRKILGKNIENEMLNELEIEIDDWKSYVEGIRYYRDKHVAHSDKSGCREYPDLKIALACAFYVYKKIDRKFIPDLTDRPEEVFRAYQTNKLILDIYTLRAETI